MIQHDPLPLTFRQKEVDQILATIEAGDSCQVVGIGSVGKSNLLRFLQRLDVRREKLGPDGERTLFVYIDANKLLKPTRWGLAELLLHQMVLELTGQGGDPGVLQAIDELHGRATAPKTRHLALRYLDRAAALVCQRLGMPLVFLFDEFDSLVEKLPARAFGALRALRDDYKYRLTYIVATRQELIRLGQKPAKIEAFEELVSPRTVWLGPYGEEDARFMIRRLASRNEISLDERAISALLHATGGHPGLLNAAFCLAREDSAGLEARLLGDERVQDECLRIWHSLPRGDQEVLAGLVHGEDPSVLPAGALDRLASMGLVGGPWVEKDEIFSFVLAETIRRTNPAVGVRIVVDKDDRTVRVGERKFDRLTRLEFNLVAYLATRRGEVCTKDELIAHLYPDDELQAVEGVADERLVTLVKRVRKQIEPLPKKPRYLLTTRGVGFKLVDEEASKS